MSSYDFSMLNDKEFELLATDLLSQHLGVRVERFKRGKDKGVDGRYFATPKAETVVQCKHWARSGVAALLTHLERSEKPKIQKLQPANYILVTSLELSRHNKQQIGDVLSPYIRSPADIFGVEDLNDLLAQFPAVERRHYKLWIASTTVLEAVLHAAILGRSAFALKEIRDQARYYVSTVNHDAALRKLTNLGIVLVTGEPGIGKTTLAGQMCLEYVVKHDYQLCVISDSLEEAEAIYKSGEKQIFYFDDFLGRNYLDALDRHEDSHIVNFMKRVATDKSKRFILTSRTTILNQGKRLTKVFRIHNIERSEYEIRVDSLTAFDKARILYNHIWFSELRTPYIEEILAERRYRRIIEHQSFNPRLISFVTDIHKLKDITASQYWPYIEQTLTNPKDIWEHVYISQLDDYSRALLLLAVFNGNDIAESSLRKAYEAFIQAPVSRGYSGVRDFGVNAAALVGAVLDRNMLKREIVTYSLFNPSIGDFVLQRTANSLPLVTAIFEALDTNESLLSLANMIESGITRKEIGLQTLASLGSRKLPLKEQDATLSYKAILCDLALKYARDNPQVQDVVAKFLESVEVEGYDLTRWDRLASAIGASLDLGIISADRGLALARQCVLSYLDRNDLLALAQVRRRLPGELGQQFEAVLRPEVVSYWQDAIEEEIREQDVLGELYDEEEISEGRDLVSDAVSELLDEYDLEFDSADVASIALNCDVGSFIADNQERASRAPPDDRDGGASWPTGVDEIDDLFQIDGPVGRKE